MAGPDARLAVSQIPPVPGSYALCLRLQSPARLLIGRLGWIDFMPGMYLYLGSAFGPGGLRARLNHHLGHAPKPHWHIDHFRSSAVVQGAWFSDAPYRLECRWSQALLSLPGAALPVPGFGASDCTQGCRAHLVAFHSEWDAEKVNTVLRAHPQDGGAYRLSKIDYNGDTSQVEDRF